MQRPNAKPVVSQRGEITLYLSGGYIIHGVKNFTLPVGVTVDIEVVSDSQMSKSDWFFNNDEVLQARVSDGGNRVCIKSLEVGECTVLIRNISVEFKIEVSGGSAVGFKSEVIHTDTES